MDSFDTLCERRRSTRSRVFWGGKILIDRDLPLLECHVKNVSGHGANVTMLSDDLIPIGFDLLIQKTNQCHRAVVTWKRGRKLGVRFKQTASAAA